MWTKFGVTLVVLLALDLVLIFAPAFSPVPRQSSKSTTQNSGYGGSDSGPNKQPAPTIPARNSVIQAESQAKHGEEEAGHDKQQQVAVVSLPEVSVASDYKGWAKWLYDWGPWVFSLLVTVFSGFQIWLLKLTLNRVSRQAVIANRQAIISLAQVEEMEKVTEIQSKTLVLQFRPKVVVRSARATGLGIEPDVAGACKLEFLLVNLGGSPAHIVEGTVQLLSYIASSVDNIQFTDGSTLKLGEGTIAAGQRVPFAEDSMTTGTVNDLEWMHYYRGEISGRQVILIGNIWYKDDIGITRQTSLYRPFDPKTGRFEPRKDSEDEYSD